MSNVTRSVGYRADLALSDVSFWTNEAQRYVWDAQPHDLSEAIAVSSTSSGENRITLPTNFQEPLNLSNTSFDPPIPLAPINVDEAASWTTQTGTHAFYLLFNNWMEVYPIPDSAYSIQLRYRTKLSEMTLATALPSVASRYRYAVFCKAKEFVARHLCDDTQKADEALVEYERYMARTTNDRNLRAREQRFNGLSLARSRSQRPSTTASLDFDHSDT